MDVFIERLLKNELFKTLTLQELTLILEPDSCIIGRYKKNAIIMQQNDPCTSIGFILEGALYIEQLSSSSETIKIRMFKKGDCFGEALLFSPEPLYPYTLITSADTVILYIPFSQIERMLKKSFTFNTNYITSLSNRIITFRKKILILSQKSVRARLILYLSNEAMKAGSLSFKLTHSKTAIADLIGVARPSVSREIKHMQLDQLLNIDKNIVTIKKPQYFNLKLKS